MLDTVAFNDVLDGRISEAALIGHEIFATYVQRSELMATISPEGRRENLMRVFREIDPNDVYPIAVAGLAVPGEVVPGGGSLFGEILHVLNGIKLHRNNPKDSLIAEACKRHGLALVTRDDALLRACERFGIRSIHSSELKGEAGEAAAS